MTDTAQWIVASGVAAWFIYRAMKRPPPVSRWVRFAEAHGLRHSPSTPFARAQLSGLWREGVSGAPVPIMIQVLRKTHTRAEGLAIWTQVPGGLPHGFQIGPEIAQDGLHIDRCTGLRCAALANHIRNSGLQEPLRRFFEDWPEATLDNGALCMTLMGPGHDPLAPIDAMVNICRRLSRSGSGNPEDLVVAAIPLGDPQLPGSLPTETINAEAKAYHEGSKDTLSLPDFTPFGSPFGLRAPDMAPPGEGIDVTADPQSSSTANEPGERLLRQLQTLTQSTQEKEQEGLLAELEQQTFQFEQHYEGINSSNAPFLPATYKNGKTTVGLLKGTALMAEIRHPMGAVIANESGPWRLQLIDWDPTKSRLIVHRLVDTQT